MTETVWSQFEKHEMYSKLSKWKDLWNVLEYLNGKRVMIYDNAGCNIWAAIALLRNSHLKINRDIQQINRKYDEIKHDIETLYSCLNALEDMIISVRKYVEDRVDVADDYLLDGIESSTIPKINPAHQLGQESSQSQSRVDLNSGVKLTSELTVRQLEIISLKKQEKTNREIAECLDISQPRVTQIIQSLRKKGVLV